MFGFLICINILLNNSFVYLRKKRKEARNLFISLTIPYKVIIMKGDILSFEIKLSII